MDYIIFKQPGGFPLTVDTLDAMQQMYHPFLNGIGRMAGTRAIICGCEQTGNKVNSGLIQVDNEMYGLIEGIKQESITICEDKVDYEFENGEKKATVLYRYATFGTGTNTYKWSDFKRVMPLNTLTETFETKVNRTEFEQLQSAVTLLKKQNAVFQAGGGMVLWNKPANQIPEGWREVVDWRGRMPVGFDPNQVEFNQMGKTGGSKTHTLFQANLPAMSFYLRDIALWGVKRGSYHQVLRQTFGNNYPIEGRGGNSTPVNHLDPYRTVLFIEFIG